MTMLPAPSLWVLGRELALGPVTQHLKADSRCSRPFSISEFEVTLGYMRPCLVALFLACELSFSLVVLAAPPSTLNLSGAHRKRKTLVAPEINISLDQSEGSLLSDDFLDTPDDLDINVDDIETPDETDSLEFLGNGNELEWEGNGGGVGGVRAERPVPPGFTWPLQAPAATFSLWFPQMSEVQRDPIHGVAGGRGN